MPYLEDPNTGAEMFESERIIEYQEELPGEPADGVSKDAQGGDERGQSV